MARGDAFGGNLPLKGALFAITLTRRLIVVVVAVDGRRDESRAWRRGGRISDDDMRDCRRACAWVCGCLAAFQKLAYREGVVFGCP